jgi:GTP cyclohydrolase I-like protein
MKQHQPRGDILRAANSYEHDSNLQKAIEEILQPRGVGVVVEAVHLCMMMRGVETQSSKTITSALRGQFRECLMTRDEFLRLAHQRVYLSAKWSPLCDDLSGIRRPAESMWQVSLLPAPARHRGRRLRMQAHRAHES